MAAAKNYEFEHAGDLDEFEFDDENDDDGDYEDFDDELGDDMNAASRKRKSIGTKRKSARFKAGHSAVVTPCTSKNLNALITPARRSATKHAKNDSGLMSKIDRLCEFVHVLMHCILYKINYYNKKTHFDKFLKYNIIVYKCKSEIVCEYITNCVESMRLLLENYYKEESTSSPRIFAIGLAVLKSTNDTDDNVSLANLLIKRCTLQIEYLKINAHNESDSDDECANDLDEWNFRESILKCLYAKDVKYPSDFKWQIQIRSSIDKLKEMSDTEDLFKLFAWRQCEPEEITSITTKSTSKRKFSFNRISIKPIKTMNHLNREHRMKVQLFSEEPLIAPEETRLNDSKVLYDSGKKTFKKYRPSFNKTLNSSNSNSSAGECEEN